MYQSGYGGPGTLSRLGLWKIPGALWSPPAGAFGCSASRLLFSGYVGLDVACLDNVLLMLGYSISPNNVVDADTTEAVRQLQSDLGLIADGNLGPVTLTAIGMWVAPSDDTPPPAGSYGCAVARILLPGYAGLDVQCVDNVLSMMGLLATPNNVVDADTQLALRRAQALFGIYQSGYGGPATLSRLSLWQTPGTSWSPPGGSFGCGTSRALPPGTQGLDVACLDNILLLLGYRITPNNLVDAATTAAVRQFQVHIGLTADGVAGLSTLTRLAMYDPPGRAVLISDSAIAGIRWSGNLGRLTNAQWETHLESCRRLVYPSCRGREGYAPRTALNEINYIRAVKGLAGPDDLLVIAVGYNDSSYRFGSDFAAVNVAARNAGFQRIVWLTYRTGVSYTLPGTGGTQRSNYAAMNNTMAAALATGAWPDVSVWDYASYTALRTSWFTADGVHLTASGAVGVAGWLSVMVAQ